MTDCDEETQVSISDRRRTSRLWFETSVVLLICVFPHIFNSLAHVYVVKQQGHYSFPYHALSSLVISTESVVLVSFIIWKSGEPIARFGLRRPRFSDFFWGIGLLVLGRAAYRLVWFGLRNTLSSELYASIVNHYTYDNYSLPSGRWEYVLLAIMCVGIGMAEELVVRAYLIPRFEELFGSTWLAVFFSTLLFASYHGYEGTVGVIHAATLGLVYGASFCILRRFAPVAFAHALQDFIIFTQQA